MQIQKIIERLGYSANEAKVYLAALGLGEAHISDIAAKVKLPRTSTQVIVDKLHKDGLMNFYVQRRYKYWVAEKPERLLSKIQKSEEEMLGAMPALTALRKSSWEKKSVGKDASEPLALFRMFADSSQQPMLIANERIEIEYVNAAWESQFGYSLHEVKGENPRILQSGKTPSDVYVRMWKCLKSGTMFQSDEIVDKRKDGTFFTLLTTVLPVTHSGHLYYIQVLDDISQRNRVHTMSENLLAALHESE
jgi:PAS domain S-box-containing protein